MGRAPRRHLAGALRLALALAGAPACPAFAQIVQDETVEPGGTQTWSSTLTRIMSTMRMARLPRTDIDVNVEIWDRPSKPQASEVHKERTACPCPPTRC